MQKDAKNILYIRKSCSLGQNRGNIQSSKARGEVQRGDTNGEIRSAPLQHAYVRQALWRALACLELSTVPCGGNPASEQNFRYRIADPKPNKFCGHVYEISLEDRMVKNRLKKREAALQECFHRILWRSKMPSLLVLCPAPDDASTHQS